MQDRARIPLTQSSLRTLGSCEEKYRLRYIEGLRSTEERPALTIGSAFHAGIEAQDAQAAEDSIRAARGAPWVTDEEDRLTRDVAILRAMVDGALSLWTHWPEQREVGFDLPLRNPATGAPSTRHVLSGVFDGLWSGADERPRLLEMKTTGRLDADYLRRLALDFQVSTYCHAATAILGRPVRDVVYRVVRKPSIRQRKTESADEYGERVAADYLERPEFYFAEELVTRSEEQLERWWHEAWEIHRRVLRLEAGEMSVRNTQHCLDFGRCDYFDLCRGVTTAEAFRVLDDVNPELNSDALKENENATQ